MRAGFARIVYALSLAGQGVQTLLVYFAATGYYIDPKLAILLFFPVFIITYWLNLIFDALVTTHRETYIKGSTGTVIRMRNTIFPPWVKKILRTVSTIWTVGIIIVWVYFFIKYSMWYLF